jgi:hypothetical protein
MTVFHFALCPQAPSGDGPERVITGETLAFR